MRMCCKCFIPTLLFLKKICVWPVILLALHLMCVLSTDSFNLLHLHSLLVLLGDTFGTFPSFFFLFFQSMFHASIQDIQKMSSFAMSWPNILSSFFYASKFIILPELPCVSMLVILVDAVDTNSWVLESFCFSATLMLHYVLALYVASEIPITIMFWSKRTWANIVWSNNNLNNESSSFQNMAFRKRHGSLKNRAELKFSSKYVEDVRNHRIDGIGRNFWISSSPDPLLKQVHLEQIAQNHIQVNFEYLQKRRFHNFSAQPLPVLCHPHSKEAFPHI